MSKKKILIADTFETPGGEEEVAYKIYELLDRSKYDVYITGTDRSKYLTIHRPTKKELVPFFVKGKLSFIKMLEFRRFVKRENFDVINVHGYTAGYFVRISCMGLKNIKIIWTMHIEINEIFKPNSLSYKIKVPIENFLSNHLFFTNHIITVCQDAKNSLRNRGIRKVPISVIYNGIDTKAYGAVKSKDISQNSKLTLGYFSRLSVQKDLPLLLRLMKEFQSKNFDIKLVIAGAGELKEWMLNYISDNDLHNVRYLGFKSSVKELFSDIDVCILPTHTECLPMILLESLSARTPVVATNVGGIREIVEDNKTGYLVKKENITSLREAILKYYNHPELLKEHGENGRKKMIEEFDQKEMVANYEKLF